MVVSVGIDVSKDKHDCFILSSEGEVLVDVFTISNTMDGFNCLLQRIQDCTTPQDKMKVGLEATGHYSYNLLGFLLDNGLATYVLNPLRTNLYRKIQAAILLSGLRATTRIASRGLTRLQICYTLSETSFLFTTIHFVG